MFRESLQSLGFRKRKGTQWTRECPLALQCITFIGRFWWPEMRYVFLFSVGVRHDVVERILRPDDTRYLMSTFAAPIHLLRADTTYHEWYLDDPDVVPKVMADIRQYGLPWLDRFSDIDRLRRHLEDESADWWFLDWQGRVETLAAIWAVQGEARRAVALLEQEVAKQKGGHRMHWLSMEKLKERIQRKFL